MHKLAIKIDSSWIVEFCHRWDIRELSIFGSAIGGTMRADSDVDVLIELSPGRYPDIDEWDQMREELSKHFGRSADLLSARGIENPFLRHDVMHNREILYAA